MNNQEFKVDIGVGIVTVAVGIVAFVLSIGMPGRADMFPKFVSVLFMIIGVLMIIDSGRKISKGVESTKVFPSSMLKNPAFLLIMLFLYILLMPVVGFYVTTLCMLICYMRIFGIRKWKTIALVTFIVMLFIFGLFTLGLNIPLPKGILR